MPKVCDIEAPDGQRMLVELIEEDGRGIAKLVVNGVPCQFERLSAVEGKLYRLDRDPNYNPILDEDGFVSMSAPYCQ